MSQESFNIETIRKYHQDNNKLLHASAGANSVGVISGISTIRTAFTAVGIPVSVSLGAVSTVSVCVGGILLLTSKKYKKKLLKCCELIDKIEFFSYFRGFNHPKFKS